MAVQTWIYGKPDVQYEGCVLSTYERNGYHDSDFYAVVWDEEKQAVTEVEYDTTRCGDGGYAKVDATMDVLRKVYRYYWKLGRARFDKYTNPQMAKDFGKGDKVVVVRGRKIPQGTVGTVFWIGTKYNFYNYRDEERVGIEVDGVRMFLPAEYVVKQNWQAHLITGKDRKHKIRNFAINSLPSYYREPFMKGFHKYEMEVNDNDGSAEGNRNAAA